jgi:hypothetical protein
MGSDEDKKRSVGFTAENTKFLGVLPASSRDYLGPLALIAVCPAFVIVLWHTIW